VRRVWYCCCAHFQLHKVKFDVYLCTVSDVLKICFEIFLRTKLFSCTEFYSNDCQKKNYSNGEKGLNMGVSCGFNQRFETKRFTDVVDTKISTVKKINN
jgi:hypothetical protein